MAGVTLAAARGGRRSLDSELNMVPMVDLMMVTISFLLITAVWTHSARMETDAAVPGEHGGPPPAAVPRLHVEMTDPAKFVLHWDLGPTVVRTGELPRHAVVTTSGESRTVRFPELRARLDEEWRAAGSHREASDPAFDELVLHTPDDAPYVEMVGAMDAAYGVKRPCRGGKACPAFRVVIASR